MLYPKCCPVEFSSVSLMDNQNPQGPGYAQKSVRSGEKKKSLFSSSQPLEMKNQNKLLFYVLPTFGTHSPTMKLSLSLQALRQKKGLDTAVADSRC